MQLADSVRDAINDAIDTAVTVNAEMRFFVTGGVTPLNEAAQIIANSPTFNASSAGVVAINTTTALEDTTPAGHASPVTRLCFYTSATPADTAFLLQLGINPTGAPDITMANNTIATTDTVQLTSLTITCPAGTPDVT